MKFDSLKFFRRVAWVVVAAGVGVATVAQDVDWQNVDLTWVALAPIVWGAIRAGAGWYVKKTGSSAGFWKLLVIPIVFSFALSGCAGFGGTGLWRPAVGDHSATKIEFTEKLADGSETEISFTASGEAAATAGINYTGEAAEGTTPWALSVAGDTSVTSPQASTVATGYATMLTKLPDTIAGLAEQIAIAQQLPVGDGAGGESIRAMIVRLLIERFLGANPDLGGLLGTILP